MVQLVMKRSKSLCYVCKVHDPFGAWLQGSSDMDLDPERMTVHVREHLWPTGTLGRRWAASILNDLKIIISSSLWYSQEARGLHA